MFGSFMPREGKFFELFCDLAEQMVLGAKALQVMMSDLSTLEVSSRNIKTIEHNADEITHHTIELLHKTFITPIDREDIHQLVSKMDDVLDYMEGASQCMFLYDIHSVPDEAKKLAELCVACTIQVQEAVGHLSNLKNSEAILKACKQIDFLETEADHVMRSALAKLFRDEPDTRQLIKIKEVYELLEMVTDRCEDVANIIEGIVLEYA